VGEGFFWYRPTRVVPDKKPLKTVVCVSVCVCVGYAKHTMRPIAADVAWSRVCVSVDHNPKLCKL